MQRAVRVAIKALATADTPDKVVERLNVGAHEATDEDHDPRNRGIIGIRRRRPIEGRLEVLSQIIEL